MVNVGIIGPGPVWESRYVPALKKLNERIRIAAVYDPVASRAEQIAAGCRATPVVGLRALAEHMHVHAVLLLDRDWQGLAPLKLLCSGRKPVYVAGSLGDDVETLGKLYERTRAEGLTVMPEFSRRYTPSTCRLRELIATRLGRPRKIVVHADETALKAAEAVPGQEPGTDFLVGLFDWCRYVVRTAPVRLQADCTGGNGDGRRVIRVEFRQPQSGGEPASAEFHLGADASGNGDARAENDGPALRYSVICEGGRADFREPAEITWQTEADGTVGETLDAERSEVEVMLDHFCRRVVGGLLPVADVNDVCQALRMAQAAERSLHSGEDVLLDDTP